MPAKNLGRIATKGSYCHVYNEAIEGRNIFNDKEDYQVFTDYLKGYLSAPVDPKSVKQTFTVKGRSFKGTPHQPKNYFNKLELTTYSLFPDHFHLILHQMEDGSIEKFIRSICTRYSMYFNKKYKRTGALFNGPYRSVHLDSEDKLSLLRKYLENKGFKANQIEKEILNKIALDNHEVKLERRILESKAQEKPVIKNNNLKMFQRIPEIAIACGLLLLLFTFSINNINATKIVKQKVNNTPIVLGISDTPNPTSTPNVTPTPSPSDVITPTPTPIPTPLATSTPTIKLIVRITDGSPIVNIRKSASIYSDKVGEAKEGQIFLYVSIDLGWYRVQLDDGTGFISSKYIKVLEKTN